MFSFATTFVAVSLTKGTVANHEAPSRAATVGLATCVDKFEQK